ncbi:DUF4870 domain-containing protein [Candidatus Gracilibacteria bacterium]|nr:DUF4870 domain-containing protein [Candidatus Gracilibacteria bacterium]
MIKTNTTTKKSTAKKAAPKKTAPKKTTAVAPKKTVAKKTTTVAQKATVAPQKTAPKKTTAKKAPVKKVTTPKISEKIIPAAPVKKTATSTATGKEGVKLLGILHLAGNLLSGGTLGLILVVLYYFFQKNKLSTLEKETCFEIINFNLSFIIYAFVASVLIFILIGLLLIPIVLITWLVLMVVGFLKHISGENYKYPFTIRFVS